MLDDAAALGEVDRALGADQVEQLDRRDVDRQLERPAQGDDAVVLPVVVARAVGVLRVGAEEDRRRVGLELTPEGRAILKRVRARRTTWLADRIAHLSDDDRERVEEALPALRRMLERP